MKMFIGLTPDESQDKDVEWQSQEDEGLEALCHSTFCRVASAKIVFFIAGLPARKIRLFYCRVASAKTGRFIAGLPV